MARKNMYIKEDPTIKRPRTTPSGLYIPAGAAPGYAANSPSTIAAARPAYGGAAPTGGENPPCNTLFIGNLGDNVLETELRGVFEKPVGGGVPGAASTLRSCSFLGAEPVAKWEYWYPLAPCHITSSLAASCAAPTQQHHHPHHHRALSSSKWCGEGAIRPASSNTKTWRRRPRCTRPSRCGGCVSLVWQRKTSSHSHHLITPISGCCAAFFGQRAHQGAVRKEPLWEEA